MISLMAFPGDLDMMCPPAGGGPGIAGATASRERPA